MSFATADGDKPTSSAAPAKLPRSTTRWKMTISLDGLAALPRNAAIAIRRPEQVQQRAPQNCVHSITLSASASSVRGTSKPSAFAVLRLMTSSNLVGY